jgi:hypothetical protein
MLIPTKFTKLDESTIFKMRAILENKVEGETVGDAYFRTEGEFFDAGEFISALDVLFVLGVLVVDQKTGKINYA